MSLHKSLRQRNSLQRRRNVLSRDERIERLERDERWTAGKDSVYGLPKVKPAAVGQGPRRAARAEAAAEGEESAEGRAAEAEESEGGAEE